ncbi:MAG: ABC transporter ATP-binding protein [Clostridia bacterium]|nr:ABC transporter ATP-binding protein [Clostridia bacterium]
MGALLEIKDLNVSYNGHNALKNINICVNEKDYVCLVGKNGSGKSTLLRSITGLIKPDSGEINFGIDKSEVGYLAQVSSIDSKFPATAKEVIMTGCQKHGEVPFYSKEDHEEFNKICETLKISSFVNKKIGELSGGQRQRVLLARTLIGKPKLLLLDEPCNGLDSSSIELFYSILDELNKLNGITIVMATHDLDEIKNEKVRVICLEQKVVYDGKIEQFNPK